MEPLEGLNSTFTPVVIEVSGLTWLKVLVSIQLNDGSSFKVDAELDTIIRYGLKQRVVRAIMPPFEKTNGESSEATLHIVTDGKILSVICQIQVYRPR